MKPPPFVVRIGTATMVAKVFIDTNIILRAFHDSFAEYPRARTLFDRLLAENTELWISRQVIREYLVQATHPSISIQ